MKQPTQAFLLALAVLAVMLAALAQHAAAVPGGATILSNNTSGAPATTPDSRSDARGTITTITLNAIQQDQNWKAYVGNVTGKLSLDDVDGNTIYDWQLNSVSKSGEIYVSRSNNILWPNVSCVSQTNVTAEELFHNMTTTQTDNINSTFNYTNHSQFYVGTVNIGANSCKSTATYVNDNRTNNPIDGNQKFQEIILRDTQDNVIFVTLMNGSHTGFDNRSYDFQIIVPESAIKATPTAYYFFTELSG